MSSETPRKTLRIGVLYEEVQLSDLVGLDIIGNLSVKVMTMVSDLLPEVQALLPLAIPMEFLYISSTLEPTFCSATMCVRPTHTYATAPKDLDILFLGGPNPMAVKDESLTYIREASKETKVVLSTCTGGMWLARSGILDGKKATTNRLCLENAKTSFPKVEWQDQRWVVDEGHFDGAKIWTAGGAGCGIDMAVEYAKKSFGDKLVRLSTASLDVGFNGKGQFYAGPYPKSVRGGDAESGIFVS